MLIIYQFIAFTIDSFTSIVYNEDNLHLLDGKGAGTHETHRSQKRHRHPSHTGNV